MSKRYLWVEGDARSDVVLRKLRKGREELLADADEVDAFEVPVVGDSYSDLGECIDDEPSKVDVVGGGTMLKELLHLVLAERLRVHDQVAEPLLNTTGLTY